MNSSSDTNLIGEVARYLAAVEVFRAERCEPTWLPELLPGPAGEVCAQPSEPRVTTGRRPGTKSSH